MNKNRAELRWIREIQYRPE